jgi:hypothetical protein
MTSIIRGCSGIGVTVGVAVGVGVGVSVGVAVGGGGVAVGIAVGVAVGSGGSGDGVGEEGTPQEDRITAARTSRTRAKRVDFIDAPFRCSDRQGSIVARRAGFVNVGKAGLRPGVGLRGGV